MGATESTTHDAQTGDGLQILRNVNLTPVSERFTLEDVESIDDLHDVDEYVVHHTNNQINKNPSEYGTPPQQKDLSLHIKGSASKVPFIQTCTMSPYPWSELQTENSHFTHSAHDSFMSAHADNLITPREKMSAYDGNSPELESGDILKLEGEDKRRALEEISTRRQNPFYTRVSELCKLDDCCQDADFITDFVGAFQGMQKNFNDAIRELIYKGPYHYVKEDVIYWGDYYQGLRSGYGWAYKIETEDIVFGNWKDDELDLTSCGLWLKCGDIYNGPLTKKYEKVDGATLCCSDTNTGDNFFTQIFQANKKPNIAQFLKKQEQSTTTKLMQGKEDQIEE
jgi:hypothetical protein